MMDELVLVTGASGYIATHIVKQLLEQGYRVRGTVRSLSNQEKIAPLRKLGGDKNVNLELVEGELLNADCWPEIVEGCAYVLHTASPLPLLCPSTEDDVIKPAVDGTLNVLRACAGKVKRVVVTSSTASVGFGSSTPINGKQYTEEDWMDPLKVGTVYGRSKILAEKSAWDYVKSLPEERKFELAVINPSLVVGAPLTSIVCTSVQIIKQILSKELPMLAETCTGVVDVCDVAKAHIAAMEIPEAAGHRHVTNSQSLWIGDIAHVIDREFRPMGYDVATRFAPYFVLWLISWFDNSVRSILPSIGHECQYDNSRLVETLGISPRPASEAILDTCYALIEQGKVKKTQKYKPRD